MSGRRFRMLLMLAVVSGLAYWIYEKRPTVSGIVDTLTRPLLGSRAAVKESERKRVISEATTAISLQTREHVGMLRENMSMSEVRELLGRPDESETVRKENKILVRWTYRTARRTVLFDEGRAVSISIR
jgi:hypothetical protein